MQGGIKLQKEKNTLNEFKNIHADSGTGKWGFQALSRL